MKKLLIVVDMQNDFIDGSLRTAEAQAVVPNVKAKIKMYETNKDKIIFTRDTHSENYLETQEGKNLPVKHCITETKGWCIAPMLQYIGHQVWCKGSFGSIGMAKEITTEYNPDEIEIVGLCTDICVISNALILKAAMPETKITVDASCCAGVTPESHKNALSAMKMCQISIINEEE